MAAFVIALATLWLASAPCAHAQMCHALSPWAKDDTTLRAGLSSVLAAYDNGNGRGEYQGVSLTAGVTQRWVTAQLSLPMYRLHDDGISYHGLGDLGADARVTVYQVEGSFAIGPELATTLPTGADNKSLGMGHVMLMPGLWLTLTSARWSLLAQLAYGRALGAATSGHHHGASAGPIVDPMNASEVENSLSARYQLVEHAFVLGRVFGALPMFSSGTSEARQSIGAGLQGSVGSFDASAELQVPLVGSPFTARLVLGIGVHG